MVAGYNGIYRTIDGGVTWETVFAEDPPYIDILEVSAIQFISDKIGFALAPNEYGTKLLKTTNAGLGWGITDMNFEPDYESTLFFMNADYGFSSFGSYLIQTKDGGLIWDTIKTSKIKFPDQIKSIYFPSPSIGYTVGGFFGPWLDEPNSNPHRFFISSTIDSGNTWHTYYRNGIALSSVYFLNDSIGFVGGYDGLIMKTTNGGGDSITGNYPSGIRKEQKTIPENICIYPNPFIDHINIVLKQPLSDKATIQIINTLGQVVHSGVLGQNESQKIIKIQDSPNGIYFLILSNQIIYKVFKLIRQ